MTRAVLLSLACAALIACDRPGGEQDRINVGKALQGTLAYPRSTMVSMSSGEEAAQLVMTSPDSVSVVARWFARALTANNWELKRTISDRNGTVTIYAEKDTRPLWLTLRPNSGGPGTTYTMIGVIPKDSVKT
ncbi:MAG TPA: hypothetical protein VFM23_10300 [Gemmatimonadales bacterium]|nr:hypothetical protein [Gemmatimonadales bacterium]